MRHPMIRDLRDESGIALLVAVILMLMVSAIALSALDRARQESTGAASDRRKIATLLAADGALAVVQNRLLTGTSPFPDTSPLQDLGFLIADTGLATSMRTGEIGTSAALPILKVGGMVRAGGQLNIGGAGTFSYGVYRTGIVAQDPTGGSVQLNAQFSVLEGGAGY